MSEDSLANANNNSKTSNQDHDGTMAGDANASRPVRKPRKIVSYGGAGKSKAKISYGGHAPGGSNGSTKAKSYEELMGAACKVSGSADNSSSRIRRRRWWGWHLLIVGVGAIVPYAIALCTDQLERFLGYWLLYLLWGLGISAILRLRADIARCHDLGWSGWGVLPFFVLAWIPGVNYISEFVRVIMFGCMDGQPFTNRFGPDPKGRELVPADANSQVTGGTSGGEMVNVVELQHLQEELLRVEADKYAPDILKEAENHRKAMAEALAEGRLDDVLLEGSKAKNSYKNAIAAAKTAWRATRMEHLIPNIIDSMIPISEKNFLIGKYPVTQDVYEAVTGENPSNFKGVDLPVTNVSYDDCQMFIEKLNASPSVMSSGCPFCLPTKEEWVFACRAGANGDYCKLEDNTEITAHTLCDVAWLGENSGGRPHQVGQKKPNAFGLFDMLGNVWEWTATQRAFGRVNCGGGYGTFAHNCALGVSDTNAPETRDNALGFRLARDRIGK